MRRRRRYGGKKGDAFQQERVLRRRLEEAGRALEEGRLREAVEAVGEVLEARPGWPQAHLHAGVALARLGERDTALEHLEEATRLAGGDVEIECSAGELFAGLGEPARAEACFRRAAARAPRDFRARFGLAVVLEQRGAYGEAAPEYEQAVALAPEVAPARLGLGNCERELGRPEAAIEHYRRAAELEPRHPSAWNNLAALLRDLGRLEEAEAACRAALEHLPRHAPAWINLATVLEVRAGGDDEIIEAWRRAAELAPEHEPAWSGLGYALRQAKRPREAIQAFERALKAVRTDNPRLITLLGRLHTAIVLARLADDEAGHGEAALATCDAWLARRPGDATMLATKAVVLHELGRDEESDALTSVDALVRCFHFDPTPAYPSLAKFNEALSRHVAEHPSLAVAPTHNATRKGLHSGELVTEPDGPAVTLKTWILECIERYAAEFAALDPSHLLVRHRPPETVMRMWGVIMHAGGHQIAHIHPAAWVSGVYYPDVPEFVREDDPEQYGWLEFGRPEEGEFPDVKPMPVAAIRPQEGMLVLFPAWFYHRTVPYPHNARRISVAFDLVPARPPDFERLLDR